MGGATKRMCELVVEGYKNNGVTRLCAVRFGNVLGSSGSVIPLFEKQIKKGGPVTVTDPNIIRFYDDSRSCTFCFTGKILCKGW